MSRSFQLICFTLIAITSCVKKNTPQTEKSPYEIHWGSGGGFTGVKVEYMINETGKIFRITNSHLTEVCAIKKETADSIHQILSNYNIAQHPLNEPGNLYKFIELKQIETSAKVVWGKPKTKVPTEIISTYQSLNQLLPKKN